MKKALTNDKKLRNFIKELDHCNPLVQVIAIERLVKIADLTEEAMKKEPEAFNTPLINAGVFTAWIELVRKHFTLD
jgi:hypothetical protein